MLTKSLSPLPDKFHGLSDVQKRYRHRHLDMIVNPAVRDVFVFRSQVMKYIRNYLDSRGYIEVDTPILTPHAGGADALPFETHHNALNMPLTLRIATELYLKRMVVGGIEKVYELGRIFRNEGISTRHNPEFTSVELYTAYADYTDMMRITEELVTNMIIDMRPTGYPPRTQAQGSSDAPTNETSVTQGNSSLKIIYQGTAVDMTTPWRRVAMDQIVHEVTGVDFLRFHRSTVPSGVDDIDGAVHAAIQAGVSEESLRGKSTVGEIINEVFEQKCESTIINPTFVTDHPVEISPLAKNHRNRTGFTERFELFIVGREYANAFSELTDPIEQRQRFLKQVAGKKSGPEAINQKNDAIPGFNATAPHLTIDEDFIDALETGLPPSGGLGIGVDRLIMLLTDAASIRDVIPFPLMKDERPVPSTADITRSASK